MVGGWSTEGKARVTLHWMRFGVGARFVPTTSNSVVFSLSTSPSCHGFGLSGSLSTESPHIDIDGAARLVDRVEGIESGASCGMVCQFPDAPAPAFFLGFVRKLRQIPENDFQIFGSAENHFGRHYLNFELF